MPYPGKLKGKEEEAKRLKQQGLNEFQIACALGVYPYAIRKLFERLDKPPAQQPVKSER